MHNDNPLAVLWWTFGMVAMIYSVLNMFDLYRDIAILTKRLSIYSARGAIRAERLRFTEGFMIAIGGVMALTMIPARSTPSLAGQIIIFSIIALGALVVAATLNARITRKKEIQFAFDNPD